MFSERRKMLRFTAVLVVYCTFMTFLIVVAMSRDGGMLYYVTVTEMTQQADPHAGNHRVNGQVATGSIERLPTGLDVRFLMTDGETTIPVVYHGVIPDTFVDDADVYLHPAAWRAMGLDRCRQWRARTRNRLGDRS